jgi:non-homologous end joining protein Ku
LKALIAAKVQGQAASPVKAPQRQQRVLDITEALQQSLANLKKPAALDLPARKPVESVPSKPKRASRSAGR